MTTAFIAGPIWFGTCTAAAVLAAVVVVSIFAVQRVAGAAVRVFMAAFRAAIIADFVVVHNLFLVVVNSPPNTALEPTPITLVCPLRGSHHRRRGSAFGR
ncbi:MAG: hypothetical protein KGL39_43620 [Patescibacteria group bacterium]|nr:hypothetical protein [Patescibacteria group bacterium]